MDPKNTKVSDFMSKPLLTLDSSTSIAEAQKFMRRNKIEHTPVTERNQTGGLLSIKDTIKKIIDPKIINAFLETTVEASQGFMTEVTPRKPIEEKDLPGNISAIIKLADAAKNVEIVLVLNVPEKSTRTIYKGIFGEEPKSIKDVCNIVA